MKVVKLVTGILSIVFSLFVLLQSCAAGISNTLSENGEAGGSAGLLVAIFLLAAGIVAIATRKMKLGGNIACIILYGLGAILGFSMAGSYTDLKIWAAYCLICAILHLISIFTWKPEEPKQ